MNEFSKKCMAAFKAIEHRVTCACVDQEQKPVVLYSVYAKDKDGLPLDNLDDIAHEGLLRFEEPAPDGFWSTDAKEPQPYTSHVLQSPTWLEVAVHANAMMHATGDLHHCFLEGIKVERVDGDVAIATFIMGS